MGQKVHPRIVRLRITEPYRSLWYANKKNFSKYLLADLAAREYLMKLLKSAMVSDVIIERPSENARITIKTARPGIVIGRKGEDVEKLRREVAKRLKVPVHINIDEVKKPELDAKLVAQGICSQLEKRVMFRRAMKRAVENAMRAGAKGIKVSIAGRLNGAEIARTEWTLRGRVPLHTFRADIGHASERAETTYGTIGVKVWIFKGEILGDMESSDTKAEAEAQAQ